MQHLKISLIQADIAWEDKKANLEKFESFIRKTDNDTQVIVLPEMFSTGFTMQPERVAEEMSGPTIRWMQNIAEEKGCALAGSVVIRENNQYFNRLVWATPGEEVQYYDKRHRFGMAGEHLHYAGGNRKLVVDWKGWKICPMICYDLRFPEWIRNRENYDLLIFVANWPMSRILHWEYLCFARAIENQSFLAAVNRVGNDNSQNYHNGVSMIVSPLGKLMNKAIETETVLTAELDHEIVEKTRTGMPFLTDMDDFEITL